MRKSIFTAALLVLALALAALGSGCNDDKAAKKTIAVIDAEAVYQKSKLAAAGMAHLEQLNGQVQQRLGQMQTELSAKPDDTDLEQRLQAELLDMQTQMDEIQRQAAGRVNELFDKVVEEYRKEQGLEAILPKQLIMASSPEANVTDAVVAKLDAQTLDFSDLGLKAPKLPPVQDSGSQAPADAGQTGAAQDAPAASDAEAPAAGAQ